MWWYFILTFVDLSTFFLTFPLLKSSWLTFLLPSFSPSRSKFGSEKEDQRCCYRFPSQPFVPISIQHTPLALIIFNRSTQDVTADQPTENRTCRILLIPHSTSFPEEYSTDQVDRAVSGKAKYIILYPCSNVRQRRPPCDSLNLTVKTFQGKARLMRASGANQRAILQTCTQISTCSFNVSLEQSIVYTIVTLSAKQSMPHQHKHTCIDRSVFSFLRNIATS